MNSILLAVVPRLLAWLMRIWFGSCRIRVHNPEYGYSVENDKSNTIVASFWHYSIIFLFYFVRKYAATAMVSASRDGEYIARLARELGFSTVRGSKNSRGVGALKALLKVIRTGQTCAIVADGSQGPPRIAQPGAVLLASKSGVPIVPMAWSASSCFTIRSWDRTAIPRPFSKIDFYFGEPLAVPPGLRSEDLEEYRLRLENRLNELYSQAWSLHGKEHHWQ